MKNANQFLIRVLGLSLIFVFTACNHDSDTDPIAELYDELEFQFEAATLDPAVNGEQATLNGEIIKTLPNHSIKYGFYWSYDKKCPEPDEQGFILVDEGVFTGKYSLKTTDLPKGVDLIICAMLRSSSNEQIAAVGEELPLKL